jgi:hypothetical protein
MQMEASVAVESNCSSRLIIAKVGSPFPLSLAVVCLGRRSRCFSFVFLVVIDSWEGHCHWKECTCTNVPGCIRNSFLALQNINENELTSFWVPKLNKKGFPSC